MKNLKNKDKLFEMYKNDELLLAALKRLFSLFKTEDQIRKECNISSGGWYSLINGKARAGTRLSIIARASAGAIIQDLVPTIVSKAHI